MNRKQEILEEINDITPHGEWEAFHLSPHKLATYLLNLEERMEGKKEECKACYTKKTTGLGSLDYHTCEAPQEKEPKCPTCLKDFSIHCQTCNSQEKDDLESRLRRIVFSWKDDSFAEVDTIALLDFIREEGEKRYREGADRTREFEFPIQRKEAKQAGRKEALNEALALFAQPGEDLKENTDIRAKLIKLL